ncbi:hypothetical protein SAMN04489724_1385 [Algoriphagus locisalis]|uniref:DUF4843 domain-containing protein n=1 Tax=Algoriphagus locisalis TaxID=305507 RepID=A0A1I6ZPH9_9BACT|nr:DUF4843 domain-containing protein [Algoriphagus locisalis]SFT64485.1 hypothetical protein SAMN04489724_1385 [Algoriphagus locisalis]
MKSLKYVVILVALAFSSCIEQELAYETFDGSVVEFDATVLNSPSPGKVFPLLTRVPNYGFPVTSSNPVISESSGTVRFRVNFVSAHRTSDVTINYSVVSGETTAVEGVHYSTPGTLVIPANSSYGELEVQTLPNDTDATPVTLVLQLEGNGSDVLPSENFKQLGISISQN